MEKILSFITKQNNTGTVVRNTFYLTVSEFFLKVLGVFWIVYLAHSVSIPEYGIYNYVTATIAIFSFLPDFGVGLIVIREIAKNPKKSPFYLSNSLFLNGILAIVTFIAILIFALISRAGTVVFGLIFIASCTLFLSTMRSVAIFYFDGREKMQYSAFLNSLNSFLLISFASLGVYLGYGLMGVFCGMLFATVISLVVSWKFLFKFVRLEYEFDRKTIIYYLKQGAPLGLAAFAALVYTHVDVLVLAKLLGNKSVGIYSSATPFAFALIQLLNVPFVVAVYPALARIEGEDRKRFELGILKSLGIILLWSVPSTFFISLTAPLLIPLIFGHKYDQGIPVLQALIYFVPLLSLSAFLYKVLIILKKQKDYLFISILAAVINIILNFIFISKFGLFGAVWSTILTQLILLLIYIFDVSRILMHKR